MERERWLRLYAELRQLDDHAFRGVFTPAAILSVFFWAVLHDRPVSWSCRPENWPADLRGPRLPSQSTMSRRLKTPAVQGLLQRLEQEVGIVGPPQPSPVKIIDAKPLPVGGHSKDPDCAWGHGVRGFVKGYKLYAIWGRPRLPLAWRVASIRVSEQAAAERLIPQLSEESGWLLGDRLYDINKLYALADERQHQLLAPRKRPTAGFGHGPHHPARLRGLAILETPAGQALYAQRDQIERAFGNLTNFGGGLAPLPSWVRRLPRVRMWVAAKLIINALRIAQLNPTAVA